MYTLLEPFMWFWGAWNVIFFLSRSLSLSPPPPNPLSPVLLPHISPSSLFFPLKWINHIWIIKQEVTSQLTQGTENMSKEAGLEWRISSSHLAQQHLSACRTAHSERRWWWWEGGRILGATVFICLRWRKSLLPPSLDLNLSFKAGACVSKYPEDSATDCIQMNV